MASPVWKRHSSSLFLLWSCLIVWGTAVSMRADALEITGPYVINSTVTWTSADSPINVTGEIDIQLGGFLNVLEDVQMNFLTAYSGILNSAGTLVMRGGPSQRIVLQGADVTSYWNGVTFGPAAQSATFELTNETAIFETGSVMQYVNVVRAGRRDNSAFQFTRSAPYLLGIDFIECYSGYHYWYHETYIISMTELQNVFVAKYLRALKATPESSYSPPYGIYVRGVSSDTGIAILEHIAFSDASFETYSVRIYKLSLLHLLDSVLSGQAYIDYVKSCQVSGNTVRVSNTRDLMTARYLGGGGSTGVVFSENILTGYPTGDRTAFYAYRWHRSPEKHRITYNTLINGRLLYDTYYDPQDMMIAHNTIQDSSYGGMYIEGGGYSDNGKLIVLNNTMTHCGSSRQSVFTWLVDGRYGEISQNIIEKSTVYNSGKALIYLRGGSNYQTSASWNVTENTIKNCTVGTGASALLLNSYPMSRFERNIFTEIIAADDAASVTLELDSSFTQQDRVYLSNNYWGDLQPDILSIRSTVQDGLKAATGAIVDFVSAFESPDLSSPTVNVSLPEFFLSDGSLGGIITADTIVELPAGNYNCSLSILVEDGAQLILEPGVTISFARNLVLSAGQTAQLNATGTEAAPITLKPIDADVTWEGVRLTSENDYEMSNLVVEGARYGIAVSGTGGLTVQNSLIQSTTNGIMHNGVGPLVLQSVIIQSAVSHCLQSVQASGSWDIETNNLVVSDCQFLDCGTSTWAINIRRRKGAFLSNITVIGGHSGVYSGREVSRFSLSNSVVKDSPSNYGVYLQNYRSSHATFEVVNNTISRTGGGIYTNCYYSSCHVDISGNSIQGNHISVQYRYALRLRCYSCFMAHISHNSITNWNLKNAAVYIYYSAQSSDGSGLEMDGNIYRNITAKNILDIRYSNAYNATNLQGYFENDLIATSTSEPGLVVIREWPVGDNFGLPCTFSKNIFKGNLCNDTKQYYLYITQSETEVPEILASQCYWNTEDVLLLLEYIYDGYDIDGPSTVIYNPFLLTEDPWGPQINQTPPFRNGKILQGWLKQGENITLEAGNYTTKSSLFIDGTLTVEPGVNLLMKDGSSLSIEHGSLIALGTPASPIGFVASSVDGSWGQINAHSTTAYLKMEHVLISGAGFSDTAALNVDVPGLLSDITIFDCSSGALRVGGSGEDFALEHFSFYDTSDSGHYNVLLEGDRNITLKAGFLSSSGSAELYVSGDIHLLVDTLEVVPKHYDTEGLYLQNVEIEISNLVFNSSVFFPGWFRGTPVYVRNYYLKSCTIQDSVINFGSLRSRAADVYAGSGSEFVMTNSSFRGKQIGNSIIDVRGAKNLILEGNSFSVSDARHAAYVSDVQSVGFVSNAWVGVQCAYNCLQLQVYESLLFMDNTLFGMASRNPYSVFDFSSPDPKVMINHFENCTGHKLVNFGGTPPLVNFTNNVILNSKLEFLMSTKDSHYSVVGGQYIIGPNYWGTTDFKILHSKTHDGTRDTALALIYYSSIFADDNCSIVVLPPSSSSILDTTAMTIGGAVIDDITVVVPAGLYYAPISIIVQHPNATVVFEAGVRIIFHFSASIVVRQGELKVLGTAQEQVYLTSTNQFVEEYGDPSSIANTSRWRGLWFLPEANDVVTDASEYIDGPILMHCIIKNAGYDSPGRASVYFDGTSIMLDGVQILNSGYRGVYAHNLDSTLVIKSTLIQKSLQIGLHLKRNNKLTELKDVTVKESTRQGLYIYDCADIRISGSHFSENHVQNSNGHQVYSRYGHGHLNISSR